MTMKKHSIQRFDMKLICGLLLSLFAVGSFAQAPAVGEKPQAKASTGTAMRHLKGVVSDATTGLPLVGISISAFNEPKYAAMSSDDGTFSMSVPFYVTAITAKAEGYGMIISSIDAKTETVKFKLYSDKFSNFYDEKIRAVKQKTAQVNYNNTDASIDKEVQRSLNGDIRAINRSGQQGMGNMYLMYGINSLIANAQPLIVIDGVIADMQYNRMSIHDGFYNNILGNLSVTDIENISVLKNGTALYGAKGGNGVLLIDTKRNKSMVTKIDVDVSGSIEKIPDLMPMMDSEDYRMYASQLLGTTGTKLTEFKFLKDNKDYFYYNQYHNNTDWSKEVYREALSQTYGINVQGGDEIASYNLSVGYLNAQSSLKNFDMSRFNLRLNSDIILSSKTDVRFDASYSDVDRDMRDDGFANSMSTTATSVSALAMIKAPILSPYQYDIFGNRSNFLSDADDYLYEVLGSSVSLANPASLLKYGEGRNRNLFGNRYINLAVTPVYKMSRFWTAKEHFSYTMVNTNSNYYTPLRGMPSLVIEDLTTTVNNVAKAMSSRSNTFFSETTVEYNRSIKSHKIHATGGFRFLNNVYSMTKIQGYNTGNDKTPNINSSLSYKTVNGVDDKNMSLTYYALGEYNYQGKYFLYGGTSLESSSRFGSDAKDGIKLFDVPWGLFPSIQGSWLVTAEPWFKPNNVVNFLKLNAGYDVSGNDDMDCTASRTYFSALRILNNIGGLSLSNIGNTKLQWETTKRATAGVDANLFNNTLSVSYNYFNGKTVNLLSLKDMNYVGGISQIWSNDGELSNTGYDFSFKFKALDTKNVKMELGASVAHYENKITKLPGSQTHFENEAYGATVTSRVGQPVGMFYGYKTDGVYATALEANDDVLGDKYIIEKNGQKRYFSAGDMNFVTTNDKEINEDDKDIIGNPNPDLYGNFFANLYVKDLTISAIFNYSYGNDIFNYQRMILENGSNFYNQTKGMNLRWKKDGDITNVPAITYLDPMGNSRFSDRWIEDGSYLRLKSITVSYDLPISNTYIKGLTVWGSANNIWTLTNYLGNDPENSASNNVLLQGIDRGLVPQGRSFAFGLKINI